MFIRTAFLLMLTLATSAWSQTLEEKARKIDEELIAPCCWTQPVAQHYSQAADEIRGGVREMLAAGKSEQEILEYYVTIHGERILASPRARGFNLLAWVMPVVFFLAGVSLLVLLLRNWVRKKPALLPAGVLGLQLDERYRAQMDQELKDFE
jgi:cytochrome c-type biogenesis protein CcmH